MERVSALDPQHWESMAAFWAQLGSPLRPSAQDQDGYQNFIRNWIQKREQPRIAILGVTPELYHLPWPAHRDLIAIDRSREMIQQVWPGPQNCVVEADWLAMPLAQGSRDLALCDGRMILLEHPTGHQILKTRLSDLLASGGRCIFRLFVPPAKPETADAVLNDLVTGQIANLNILKLRLGMALQKSAEEGVSVQEIRRLVHSLDPDLERLAARLGWPFEHLRVLEAYRDSPARYHFASEAQIAEIFGADGDFEFIGDWKGTYSLAERCPIVAFQRS